MSLAEGAPPFPFFFAKKTNRASQLIAGRGAQPSPCGVSKRPIQGYALFMTRVPVRPAITGKLYGFA